MAGDTILGILLITATDIMVMDGTTGMQTTGTTTVTITKTPIQLEEELPLTAMGTITDVTIPIHKAQEVQETIILILRAGEDPIIIILGQEIPAIIIIPKTPEEIKPTREEITTTTRQGQITTLQIIQQDHSRIRHEITTVRHQPAATRIPLRHVATTVIRHQQEAAAIALIHHLQDHHHLVHLAVAEEAAVAEEDKSNQYKTYLCSDIPLSHRYFFE